ncbi:MAG TPA: prephenate dehydrogenase [Patescibacteria group bacterium]|nr:prephenate dehydrogenase [Patescibacteria group bacterium]
MSAPFPRATVLGVGLIGGSFALALRRAFPAVRVAGWDRGEVLDRALERGIIDRASTDLSGACRDADLVYLSLPVEESIRRLPEIAAAVPAGSLVTDSGSTKTLVCDAAQKAFLPPRLFLGGHPITGKELGGCEHASADLFSGAPYVLAGESGPQDERISRLTAVIEAMGARPVWLAAERHDYLIAFLSHLPQIAAVALAETVLAETGEAAASLAGPGLRDSLRLAGSPYALWADIFHTSPCLDEAIERLIASLERLRSRVSSGALAEDFEQSGHLYKILRGR